MTIAEINRQIVQEGLDRKAAARKQRMKDADHDAAERQLREVINRQTQERRAAIEAAQAAEQRRKARRAREAREIGYFADNMLQVFGGATFAALVALGFNNGVVTGWIALPVVGLASIYSIVTFIKYASRCLKKAAAAA